MHTATVCYTGCGQTNAAVDTIRYEKFNVRSKTDVFKGGRQADRSPSMFFNIFEFIRKLSCMLCRAISEEWWYGVGLYQQDLILKDSSRSRFCYATEFRVSVFQMQDIASALTLWSLIIDARWLINSALNRHYAHAVATRPTSTELAIIITAAECRYTSLASVQILVFVTHSSWQYANCRQ